MFNVWKIKNYFMLTKLKCPNNSLVAKLNLVSNTENPSHLNVYRKRDRTTSPLECLNFHLQQTHCRF